MRAVANRFLWRAVDRVVGAGTTEIPDLHERQAAACGPAAAADLAGFLARWNAARTDYTAGRFDEALAGFEAASALRPDDRPCLVFIARCKDLQRAGAPAVWDGIWRHEQK